MNLHDQTSVWKTPHGMGNVDANGKKGGSGGGEFAKQANNWNTPSTEDGKTDGPAVMARVGGGHPKQCDQRLRNQTANWTTPQAHDSGGGNPTE